MPDLLNPETPADASKLPPRVLKGNRGGSDALYKGVLYGASGLFAMVCLLFLWGVISPSIPAWRESGLSLIFGRTWDPSTETYGAFTLILGTLETTAIALLFAVPIGIGTALAIVHLLPARVRIPVSSAVELLAAVPSVVYGMFGLVVLAPIFSAHVEPWLAKITGGRFPFGGTPEGVSVLLAGCVLFVMVLPTIVALSRDVISTVPRDQIEGALSVGASRWQMLYRVVLPWARTGITGAVTLATARALGETIAVAMVIGVNPKLANSLFAPGSTLAATIATQFQGSSTHQLSYLYALAVILMVMTISVNWFGRRFIKRAMVHSQ
jgi:phosphate transport system permease protein